MKKCFIFVREDTMYAQSMVKTAEGWEVFSPRIILVGELGCVTNESMGRVVTSVVEEYRENAPEKVSSKNELDAASRFHGFKSYRAFFRDCLQMSVEKVDAGYIVRPYERLREVGTEGAIPTDIAIFSKGNPEDLGSAIRQCIVYCV